MRFPKAPLLVSLILVFFEFNSPLAKAAGITILFNDLTDTITVSPSSSRVAVVPGTCSESTVEFCEIALIPPLGAATIASTTIQLLNTIGEGSASATTPISDILSSTAATGLPGAVFTFNSDLELGLGLCPSGGCTFAETSGDPVTVGSILWSDGTTDVIQFESLPELSTVVPEPVSLILLGSGLAIAGGFLRRRRAMTPSV
jgi:hypothetical protein